MDTFNKEGGQDARIVIKMINQNLVLPALPMHQK
jgi:hypothetical protein